MMIEAKAPSYASVQYRTPIHGGRTLDIMDNTADALVAYKEWLTDCLYSFPTKYVLGKGCAIADAPWAWLTEARHSHSHIAYNTGGLVSETQHSHPVNNNPIRF